MKQWSVLLLLLVFAAAAEAQDIIYPGQLDHAEGDDCLTRSGRTGWCSRSCGHSARYRKPRKCGIKNDAFLVCCDKAFGGELPPFTNIYQPDATFQCGRNARNSFYLSLLTKGYVYQLRPEAPPLPPLSAVEKALRDFGNNVPGIPPERLEEEKRKLAESLPPGVAGALGGINADKNAWPWMALVGERSSEGIRWFCGAVLINELWVLSAHHCFFHNTADVVRLGEHNYNDDDDGAVHQDFGVAETVLYPDFTFGEAYHDLALLRLDPRVTIQEFISPVCLPWYPKSDKDITAQKATLTGWGDTQYGGFPSSILQEVNVTVFPSGQCDSSYSVLPHYTATWPRGIGQETLCAGDPNGGRDACQGDSGGPLVSQDARGRFVLAAVVSQGYGCGHKDYPGLYINLRHSPYLAWIKNVAFATF